MNGFVKGETGMKTVLKIAAGMGAAGLILILTISLITGKTALTSQDLGIDVDQLENGVGIRVGDHWMGMGSGTYEPAASRRG